MPDTPPSRLRLTEATLFEKVSSVHTKLPYEMSRARLSYLEGAKAATLEALHGPYNSQLPLEVLWWANNVLRLRQVDVLMRERGKWSLKVMQSRFVDAPKADSEGDMAFNEPF